MKKETKKKIKQISIIALIVWSLTFIYVMKISHIKYEKISYNDFIEKVENKEVEKVILDSSEMIKFVTDGEMYETDNPQDIGFKKYLLENGLEVEVETIDKEEVFFEITFSVMRIGGTILLFVVLIKSMGMELFKKKETLVTDVPKISFRDIAGNNESKEEMKFLVNFLKEPEKYNKMGAKLPKGVVFYGPPGTGKTLTARALAGEAGVPFFSASGSDFVEMYVGLGAKRVRELFDDARNNAPCIVFIDEIDAVGTSRGGRDGNSEKDQTINALLAELDGFNSSKPIVVIIATNRVEDLDKALIRPGRFDRHIAINLPDNRDRLEILNLYAKNKKISSEIDLEELAKLTIGFSGAGLEALINESAIIAVNKSHSEIKKDDIDDAYFKIVTKGNKKQGKDKNQSEIELTAYHEAGHALCAKLLTDNDVPKVTIIPSTSGYGGATFNIPKRMELLSKKEILNNIRVLYAGRAAEFLLRGNEDEITTGASQDIKQATEYIKSYFCEFGMSEKYGMLSLSSLTDESHLIIEKATLLSNKLYKETVQILKENREILNKIAKELIEKETLNEGDLDRIIHKVV